MNTRINDILKYYRDVKMNNKPNLEFKMNPYKGFGNRPYLLLNKPHPPLENAIYNFNKKEGCYWFQDPIFGTTDFLYHGGELEETDGKLSFQTKQNNGGYGDRTFRLKVRHPDLPQEHKGWVWIDVRGPWSGGCYLANKVLPKPATEITYWEGGFSYTAGYLTLEVVNKLLEKYQSRWKCILLEDLSSKVCPEFVYAEGQEEKAWETRDTWTYKRKEEWTPQTINALDLVWKTAWPGEGQPRTVMQGRI